MSKTYTQTLAHALVLANDSTFDSTVAGQLIDEIYQRYWFEFLKDRVKLVDSFVSFTDKQIVVVNAVAARDIVNLEIQSSTATTDDSTGALIRDEFHAVVEDSKFAAPSSTPLRWGAQKVQGSQFFRVAIFPPASTPTAIALDAEVLPEYTTPSGATALEGDDVDAFNVARLAACEIMARNGDDPQDIQLVFGVLDKNVREKFAYIVQRARPNTFESKDQG